MPPDFSELKADDLRQAGPLFRGVAYQVWQTVSAWIDLDGQEILVVEGAEDLDRIAPGRAEVNQIKNLASSISLRSECVCDALRNYWSIRQKNPERLIRYRFITTASFARESGDPFGVPKPGLALWNEEALREPTSLTNELKNFLLSDGSVSRRLARESGDKLPALSEYLEGASEAEFHLEFVRSMQWLQQQPAIEVVRSMVAEKLHAY